MGQGSLHHQPSARLRSPGLFLGVRLNDTLLSLLVALIAFVVYVLSPVATSTDSAYTFHVSTSLLHQADIRLDEFRPRMDLDVDYRLMLVDGHIYSYYPTAVPLLALPVAWLADQLFPSRFGVDFYTYLQQRGPDERTARLELWLASFISAFFVMVVYRIGRHYALSPAGSLLLAFIAAFASPMYSTSSRALWQHGPSALALVLVIYFLLLYRSSPARDIYLFLAALFLALSYLVRPTNSLSVIFFSLYVLVNHRPRLLAFLAIMAGILALFMLHSLATYGSLLPPYSFQLFDRLASPLGFFNALAGLLVSPNRGLLVFSPVLIFSFVGIYFLARQGKFNLAALEPYLLAVFIFHWLLTAAFEQWDGGWTLGPRYMADLTGFLVIMLIPFVAYLLSPAGAPIWLRLLFSVSLVLSLAINSYISISHHPFYWTGKPVALTQAPARVWDWADLQFLRGTCPSNPREGRAPACWFAKQ